MPITLHRTTLLRQREAVVRAMQRARATDDLEDAELLLSVANLLEELHRIKAFITTKPKVTH